jgi:two-component system chemotaxis response regulator CheY
VPNEAKNIRILVVDDQKAMRMLIRSTLSALGCIHIAECGDGRDAIVHIANHQVDLIISDLTMPNTDGFGLLRAVRAEESTAKIPFIMLTSHSDLAMVKDAVALGVNNYILKPFNLGTVKSKIEALLGPLA